MPSNATKIRKKKEAMVDRWGIEVTGGYQLDEFGFPVQQSSTEKKS